MPAQLKVSVSANQKAAASCGGEWPQITHWYWNRLVKLQLPVRVLSQSLRNESSAGSWLQLNSLFGSSCGVYCCLLFSRDHLLFSPALFPSSLEMNWIRAPQRTSLSAKGKMLRQSLWAPCTRYSSMPATYTVLCGPGHLHCDILIFMTRALFLSNQDATRCY